LIGNQLKPYTATFKVEPTWTERSARKKAEAFAANFETQCKAGTETDNRQTFQEYAEYVLRTKETSKTIKHSTIVRYKELTERIYPVLGHIKLKDIRPQHLNEFYGMLAKEGQHIVTAEAKAKLNKVIEDKKLGTNPAAGLAEAVDEGKRISNILLGKAAGISASTVSNAVNGRPIQYKKAVAIATALGYKVKDLFAIEDKNKPFEDKTILEYHRLISSVLAMAEEELIVPYNAASKARPPKAKQKDVNFYEPETIKIIKAALDKEPLKLRLLGYLLAYSGCRRGEILGIKWEDIDFTRKRIHIVRSVLYTPDLGIYIDTPKTTKSVRWIALPDSVMSLLMEYKAWQDGEAERLIGYWQDTGFVFTRDNGTVIHPDTVNSWLTKLQEENNLPHLNPHAFRHSYVSALIFAGVDPLSIAASVGHSKVSTTENIYGHVFEAAEERNASVIASVYD
jgi:integrase